MRAIRAASKFEGVTDIRDFIRRLPKAELHLHLEGTILPATLVELSERHDATPLTLPEAEALYRFTDFTGFIECLPAVTRLLTGPDDYELAAWRMMQHLAAQGIVHAEVYISVGVIYMWRNHDPALLRAHLRRPGTRPPARRPRVGPLALLDLRRRPPLHRRGGRARLPQGRRNAPPSTPPSSASVSAATSASAGSEPFRALYAEAARAGLRLTNHAGETTGPEAIREALSIGSERIGHALSAIQDESPPRAQSARSIPLELNPTSNVRTGVCRSFAAHPLRRYFDLGLLVTLNSDDPAFFGSDLANEFLLAHTEQGFTREELRQLAANSIRASFLPESDKSRWLARIETTV